MFCINFVRCTEADAVSCPGYDESNRDLWLPSVKRQCMQVVFEAATDEGVKLEDITGGASDGKKTVSIQIKNFQHLKLIYAE